MLESSAPRVVVLGRAGDAQLQLQHALDAIGAQTLATGEIDQLDPEQMRDARPNVILVSMDEHTDGASLDRWQALFDAPGTTVVFDDAEVTRHLSGWDLARWARHLAAKVLGKTDVLPPVEADAERLPNVDIHDAAPALETPFAAPPVDAFNLDLDESVFTMHATETETVLDAGDDIDFAALSTQFEAEQQRAAREDTHAQAAPTLDELIKHETLAADTIGNAVHLNLASAEAIDGVDGSSAFANNASAKKMPEPISMELTPLDADLAPAKPTSVATDAGMDFSSDFSSYALEPLQGGPGGQHHQRHSEISAYALEPLQAGSTAAVSAATTGLIAIVAGLGGPDAVRHVLAGLPKTLPVPVLLWQHLDAGKHDRLAQQLTKASALPVYLAEPGGLARPGAVAVMTASIGVKSDIEGWWFHMIEGGLAAAVESALGEPASMLMVLSGADSSLVDVAAAHAARGSEVHAQTPDSCFDDAAVAALSARGVPVVPAAQLAAVAAAHWPDKAPVGAPVGSEKRPQ